MVVDLLQGRTRGGAVVNLALAGAANAAALFTLSTFASMVGTKTLIITRLKIQNNGAGNGWFHIGTGVGAAFVHMLPAIWSINNTTDDYGLLDLPRLEVVATITGYPDVVGAGNFNVQVEVEERG